MRALIIATLALMLAAPAVAQPKPYRGQCRKLGNQMVRYLGDAEMARARGNELWERASLEQMNRLALRRASLCPHLVRKDPSLMQRVGAFLGTAARLGLKALALGLI